MTWLSRLLPQSNSLTRYSMKDHTQRSRRARRYLALEPLEDRTVLSDVTAVYNPLLLSLTITGDVGNDYFKITENAATAGGNVVVASTFAQTTINTTSVPFNTVGPVKSIAITLPGTNNTDKLTIVGPGNTAALKTTVQSININVPGGAILGLNVSAVYNPGTFVLTTSGTLRNVTAPPLAPVSGAATIDNSTFTAVTITQTGTCPAAVTLSNDTVSGSVKVTLGDANSDAIILIGDNFGATTLVEGKGNTDTVNVSNSTLKNLTVRQGLGNGDIINIQNIIVNGASFGVVTVQGNGTSDVTTVNGVTTINNPQQNFTNPAGAGISVTQGDGNTDTATVSNSTVPGDVSITQGNGNGDKASLLGVIAGSQLIIPGVGVMDILGTATITQGNGAGDIVNVTSGANNVQNSLNNLYINQGNNLQTPPLCTPFVNDEVHVNDSKIFSDLIITQGLVTGSAGYYLTTIGDTSAVVTFRTAVTQQGAQNIVGLGYNPFTGTSASFLTSFLDVFTGAGDAFVAAQNTTVVAGSFVGNDFVIDGTGTGNVFWDVVPGSSSGVTANPATFNSI